jgi:FAD dependent oxidoreductase TIGR03364
MARNGADVAIVGAGILGLAHAYAAAKRGCSVVVFERGIRAQGASVRNFGMIWPVGQPPGEMHGMALRSRELWLEVLHASGLPYLPTGSLHVAYRQDENAVIREFCDLAPGLGYECEWLAPEQVLARSHAVRAEGLHGALWSPSELTVDPRLVLAQLPEFLAARFGVEFHWGTVVHSIALPGVETAGQSGRRIWKVDRAIVCGGDDSETLYPELFIGTAIVRCKLQMMRTHPQPNGWQLGPALASGLTLRFYPSFSVCTTLDRLKERVARETPEYDRWVIHGLVSQTAMGELTLGDSHEYGNAVDIFDKAEIDELILAYVKTFLQAPRLEISQRWNGVYSKHREKPFVSLSPADGVRVVTAVGGSGMTLSFGLAENTIQAVGI